MFSKRQETAVYDFVPYKYGCFSYSANADMTAMVKQGFLTETENKFAIAQKDDYLKMVKDVDYKVLFEIKRQYGGIRPTNPILLH